MSFCQESAKTDSIQAESRRARLRKLIAPTTAHADIQMLQNVMADSLRRAGIKLKAVISMNRRSQSQVVRYEEQVSPKRCYLLELPTELILEITSHLTVLPEACLALTCKRMFAISGAILDSKSLRFSRDFAPLFHHYRNGHSFATTRWQLLKALENGRWRACSKCLKLHPRSAFPPRELRRRPEDRACILGDLAGVVDLCPCKKLTFRDKVDLVEVLKIRQQTLALLGSQFGGAKDRFCWHSCTEDYGPTQLQIEIYPDLDEEDRLKIRTEYHLTTAAGQLGKEESITARWACAHRSLDLFLSGVTQTTICQMYEKHCASCRRISLCSTCNTALRCPRTQPYRVDEKTDIVTYYFWTERCLGGASPVPDTVWASQRIHPAAEASVGLHNCDELCPWTIRDHPPLHNAPSLDMDIIDPALQDQSLGQLYSSM